MRIHNAFNQNLKTMQELNLNIRQAVNTIKQTGAIIDNVDLIKIMDYINEYEPTMVLSIEYNSPAIGKTKIIKK